MPSDATKFCYGNFSQKMCNLDQPYLPFVDTEDNGWSGDPINYKTNSYGFRSKEFTYERESITFLGCSHTYGVGLPVDRIWCHLVANVIGLPYYNLSVGAGSLDSAFRVMFEWFPTIQSKYVFLQKPEPRREVIQHNGIIERHLPSTNDSTLLGEDECRLNSEKNILAIEKICEKYGSKLVIVDNNNFQGKDVARDKMHFGYDMHEYFAKAALKLSYK